MAWSVLATATYSNPSTATTVTNNVQGAVAGVSSATPRADRFSPGINNPTATVVTVSYEVPSEEDAKALASSVHAQFTTTNRVHLLVGLRNLEGGS